MTQDQHQTNVAANRFYWAIIIIFLAYGLCKQPEHKPAAPAKTPSFTSQTY